MKKLIATLATSLVIASSWGFTFQENFDSSPSDPNGPFSRGWKVIGETNLFRWNSTNQTLDVTWDSAQPNSFFYRKLPVSLSANHDFSLGFDLLLREVGSHANKPNTFQLAIGFINIAQATNNSYFRATGFDSPNLVEFNYFPDFGFGATVSPTFISETHEFASSFNWPIELTPGDLYRVEMNFTSSNRTLVTTLTRNGQPFEPIENVILSAGFRFATDAVAVCSYSDAGQDPMWAGSIMAHGTIDNFVVSTPSLPSLNLQIEFRNGVWNVRFASENGWVYFLERTTQLGGTWQTVTSSLSSGGILVLQDNNPPAEQAYYRVRGEAQ